MLTSKHVCTNHIFLKKKITPYDLRLFFFFLYDYNLRFSDQIRNPSSYVRDYYFFKGRSQFSEIELVHMKPEDAFNALQRQELVHKFVEIGKVLLTWAILKNVDMVVQRVVFLHEELMKLPSFPRRALEADLDLYKGGEIGRVSKALFYYVS